MLNTVVRVSSAGDLLGTGSLVGVPSESIPGKRWPYVITAHHVIENQVEIELDVPDPLTHAELFPRVKALDWSQPLPGADLAVSRFPEGDVPRWQATPMDGGFTPENHVPPLGGQIHYLGIFAPLGVPMARSGTLGALDIPIEQGNYGYMADLIDCRSYGGFSGSPCFSSLAYAVLNAPRDAPEDAPPNPDGSRSKLGPILRESKFYGMLTAHYSDEDRADGVISRYGVCIVLPADTIREALLTEPLRQERREWDAAFQAARTAAQPPLENLSGAADSDEFKRFEDLTRKLVQMPKPADESEKD